MTVADTVTSAIAILSLLISAITAYATLLARFKGRAIPKRRAILYQFDNVPYVVLECEFSNEGARQGYIEDLMLKMIHPETGSEFHFIPQYTKQQFNVLDKYELSDFSQFSGISLSMKERKELYVAFKPLLRQFSPPVGLVRLHTRTKINGRKMWLNSNEPFSLLLNEDTIRKWTSPPPLGEPQQLEALEIGISRQRLLDDKR